MWQLISTWDRQDGSVAVLDAIRRRPSIVRRLRARRNAMRAERLAAAAPTADHILAALDPVARRFGMGPAQGRGDSITWCTSADQLRTIGQEERYGEDGPDCTDLNVSIDQHRTTISVDLDGHGLAEFITGRSHGDGPIAINLDHDLDAALALVAPHLDRLCESVIIADR